MTHPLPDPAVVAEDVEDLKATVAALTAQLATLTGSQPAGPGPGPSPAGPGPEEEGYPPFILLLEGDEYEAELRALAEWVEGVLVPGYLGEASQDARWCQQWTEHTVAIARLHALWLAWQELTDPATCGYTGPSIWHRDHLDPCIRELRAPSGPFAGCIKGERQIHHRLPSRVPSGWSTTSP